MSSGGSPGPHLTSERADKQINGGGGAEKALGGGRKATWGMPHPPSPGAATDPIYHPRADGRNTCWEYKFVENAIK